MAFTIIFGLVWISFGVYALYSTRQEVARRRRLRATPTSPISQATGGRAAIRGHIEAGEEGLVEAPFSGRQAVWVRATVEQYSAGGANSAGTRTTLASETASHPFSADDNSGETARILPDRAEVILDKQEVADSGHFHDLPPRLDAFLAAHDLSTKGLFGLNKRLLFNEELLAPGDALYALGPSRREPAQPVSDDSGFAHPGQLVMYAGAGADGELILTNKAERQLVSRLAWNRRFILVIWILGIVFTIFMLIVG